MADLLAKALEQPKIETTPAEDSYVEDERRAVEEEKRLEQEEDFIAVPDNEAPTTTISTAPATRAAAETAVQKDEAMIEVEKVLEKGLGDVYKSLPDTAKPLFKKKGEETAAALAQMVRSLNLQLKKALELIRNWLLTIPKVNKFFLEQEAKIKVDEIQELIDERKEDLMKQP